MKIHYLFFLLIFNLLQAQTQKNTCVVLNKINQLIKREHVMPKPVDDSLSVYVFDNLFDALDPSRNIFLKSEYDVLAQKYRLHLDDYILKNDCSFLTEMYAVHKTGLERKKAVLEKIKLTPIDYSKPDTIRFFKKSFPVYMKADEVEKVWRKKIRFEILDEIAVLSKNTDSLKTHFETIEPSIKEKTIANEICHVNTLLSTDAKPEELLYNYFCTYFDPHTAYFSDDSKSTFEASLSKEHLSMGLTVSLNEKNEIIVAEIDPNGPAFQTGQIKKGDQIVAVSNQKEKLEVSCASLEAISNLISSETNKNITLTLQRNSKKNFDVYIEKKVMKDEENSVFSFIIGKESKVGYIKIPSFYADLEGKGGAGCAEDVAKEIYKLDKDHIKGLVIDLIDNGGGSMEEAIKLAGMFINTGAISIVIDKTHTQMLIDDPYKGMLYKGPIVILVNGNTASASEFFSAIMQDYNRALLLGNTTLGKATMQTILPLDETSATDFVKLTINKFYRITGKSHQYIGVTPDVVLPEFYENMFQKERDFPTAIKNDSIVPSVKFKPFVKRDLINKLAENSKKRIAQNEYFNNMKTVNKSINELVEQSKTEVPMTLDSVIKLNEVSQDLWEKITKYDATSNPLDVYNSTLNQFLLGIYPNEKTINQYQIDNLKNNPYLSEAVTIINDFNHYK
ncbi:carboxy terminal-processing peptidase [Flavobacterium agrisoli]|uniref:Carboxy terminal-processing peptidase n=1 Tax=Flavobacterium agrisoli TaxID=2793066 RepID=A0A934PL13_9FLAO|nr:carboxy terminal-processing peptidase [Flavobacterium agrisoli]MBK0370122.1 carboxy terminal-processing peptidase [Flavobacterium agrisoli]